MSTTWQNTNNGCLSISSSRDTQAVLNAIKGSHSTLDKNRSCLPNSMWNMCQDIYIWANRPDTGPMAKDKRALVSVMLVSQQYIVEHAIGEKHMWLTGKGRRLWMANHTTTPTVHTTGMHGISDQREAILMEMWTHWHPLITLLRSLGLPM